jgi:hypothetical protein
MSTVKRKIAPTSVTNSKEPPFQDADVASRIEQVSSEVKTRLDGSVTSDGRIDLEQLEVNDPVLFGVLQSHIASKTWRDDTGITASDVAKLIEAQSAETPLGLAIKKLRDSMID